MKRVLFIVVSLALAGTIISFLIAMPHNNSLIEKKASESTGHKTYTISELVDAYNDYNAGNQLHSYPEVKAMTLMGESSLITVKAKVLSIVIAGDFSCLVVDDGTRTGQINYFGSDEFKIDKRYTFLH